MKKETLEERSYNERDLIKCYCGHTTTCDCEPEQERSYSEEDLREAFKCSRTVYNYKSEWEETYSDIMTSSKFESFDKWFEQFKK